MPLLDGQYQQHDNSKAAIMMAATQAAAENITSGGYAVTAQLLAEQCRQHDNVRATERELLLDSRSGEHNLCLVRFDNATARSGVPQHDNLQIAIMIAAAREAAAAHIGYGW